MSAARALLRAATRSALLLPRAGCHAPTPSSGSGAAMAAAAAAAAGMSTSSSGAKPVIRGVVFDMDGTLTVPVIDFALMRRRVGVTQGDILDVIGGWPEAERARAYAAIAEIEQQALADMKVCCCCWVCLFECLYVLFVCCLCGRTEVVLIAWLCMRGARQTRTHTRRKTHINTRRHTTQQLMPGLPELCRFLDAAGVPRGLITRNVKSSIEYFHSNHVSQLSLAPFEPAISRECAFPYKPSPAALLHICEGWGVAPSEVMMVGDSAKVRKRRSARQTERGSREEGSAQRGL